MYMLYVLETDPKMLMTHPAICSFVQSNALYFDNVPSLNSNMLE